jgi:hypothetical protein
MLRKPFEARVENARSGRTRLPGRCVVQQIRVTKERRRKDSARRAEPFEELPLDPRDPDIVRAKRLKRTGVYS